MTITKTNHPTWGNCIHMTNGTVELLVTTDYGPRVISANLCGMENIFYQDTEKKPLGEKFEVFGGDIHVLYGGHRLWIAPEILPRCYHPDNAPVTCESVSGGMKFIASVEEQNHIRKSITVTLGESGKVNVLHQVENVGLWDVNLSLWCLSMLDKGGKLIMPITQQDTGLLPNRNISLWAYSNMADHRVYWGKEYMTLQQDENTAAPIKIGYSNGDGWAAYFNKGQAFVKYFDYDSSQSYPDNGCNFETFTNDVMLESETLGPLVNIAPGACATHSETWVFHKADTMPTNDECDFAKQVKGFIAANQ
ncbi:MAG: hypothetical protein FWB93_01065 [Oscillospiraceae bacterium]|nr:hypothetical protein [Oscillospiraceae bacterium]